jgi:hypothetical protein
MVSGPPLRNVVELDSDFLLNLEMNLKSSVSYSRFLSQSVAPCVVGR